MLDTSFMKRHNSIVVNPAVLVMSYIFLAVKTES